MDLTTIFCKIDDFFTAKNFSNGKFLTDARKRNRKFRLCPSEIATIVVYFHLSNYRNFKHFYFQKILGKQEFPNAVSYNRFVELMPLALILLTLFQIEYSKDKCTGISFIDSTILKVCDNRRIHSHKVMKDFAKRGKSSTGWFYGFKLHLITNDRGEIISLHITTGNVDDRNLNMVAKLTKGVFGKMFGDRGYISQKLFEYLFQNKIQLITKIKSNMKNKFMNTYDKLMLRKRAVIESINDELKNICQIAHTRHRSPANFFVNLISGIVAYSFLPKKPSLHLDKNFLMAS
jgi:hypothetical protein